MNTPTPVQAPAQTHAHAAQQVSNHSTVRTRTANLTLETPLLGAALLVLVAGVLAFPDVALLLLGIPAAIVLGVATMATVARLLVR